MIIRIAPIVVLTFFTAGAASAQITALALSKEVQACIASQPLSDTSKNRATKAACVAKASQLVTLLSPVVPPPPPPPPEICGDQIDNDKDGLVDEGCPVTPPPPPPPPPGVPGTGIWISDSDLQMLPTSGAAWTRLLAASKVSCGTPNLEDQDDKANVCVMAKALVAARMHDDGLKQQVVTALSSIANDTSYTGRALSLGRELAAYVIAADIINLSSENAAVDTRFRARIKALLTTATTGGPVSLIDCHNRRPNNWGSHCGASRIAVAAYLGDVVELENAAAVFRGFLGDRAAYAGFSYGDLDWQNDPSEPVGINPLNSIRSGHSIDGVLPDDQRRSETGFVWPPPKENYVYESLQGAVAAAVMLERAGYPAFEWSDKALLRAWVWLQTQANYPPAADDAWETYLINRFYGQQFATIASSPGKNVGFTDWTHGAR